MNDYKYKVFKLCDFSVENDTDIGNFDGDIIAIRIDGKMPWGYERYYIYNGKRYLIFALSNDDFLDGHELPDIEDFENPYDYSFIIPNKNKEYYKKEFCKDLIKSNFYDELRSVDDNEELGGINISFFNFIFPKIKTETNFNEINL